MAEKKSLKKKKYENFFFCMGLRTGVITLSIVWLIEGLLFMVVFLSAAVKNNKNDMYSFIKSLSWMLTVHFIALSVLSAYGLYALTIHNTIHQIRMYSYISWFFAVFVNAVTAGVSLISMVADKFLFVGWCVDGYAASDIGPDAIEVMCTQTANHAIVWLIIGISIQVALHVYFSIILRAYLKKRIEKEQTLKRHSRQSGMTKAPGTTMFIKVDKSVDVSQLV